MYSFFFAMKIVGFTGSYVLANKRRRSDVYTHQNEGGKFT